MHETINVNFKMNIFNDGNNHTIQFHDIGKRFVKNDKTYIKIKEPLMEDEKYNNLMFICDNNEIVIIRNGYVNMKQTYKENQLTKGMFKNKYITSEISTYTKKYYFSKDNIYLSYDVVIDDDIIGNYQMELNIKGVGNNE